MVEGFYLAAVPEWFHVPLFSAMRNRDDGRDQGIVERLCRFSFVGPVEDGGPIALYTVHPTERALLQRRWIAQDPQAYLAAHARALAFWQAHPDPDAFVQAQNLFYHKLFVNLDEAVDDLIVLFRTYGNERQLAAIDHLLSACAEGRDLLALLNGSAAAQMADLLAFLQARVAQLRGDWTGNLRALGELRQKPDLPARLLPFVLRARAYALEHEGQFVAAIEDLKAALALFERAGAAAASRPSTQAERGYTLIALGDAHVGLAEAGLAYQPPPEQRQSGVREVLRSVFYLISYLPLIAYLGWHLGRHAWRPRFWVALRDMDWMIARLFAAGARHYVAGDRVLQAYGQPSEGEVADERLAALLTKLGDVTGAHSLYSHLLEQEGAPLGEYRKALAHVGAARTSLRLGDPASAERHLQTALPTLQYYQDQDDQAEAQALLAAVQRASGASSSAIPRYQEALRLYLLQQDTIHATEVADALQQVAGEPGLSPDQRNQALQAAEGVEQRRYPVRYRHPATVTFQHVVLAVVALVVFVIPILAIHVDTGSWVVPEITFRASPLLQPVADYTPNLSQGVRALNLAPLPNPEVLAWAAGLLLAAYLVLSTLFGLLLIALTPLRSVQRATWAEAVRLDAESLRVGQGPSRRVIELAQVREFVTANVDLGRQLLIDDSTAVLVTPQGRTFLQGSTARYPALLNRITQLLPGAARRVDLSYNLLRGKLGLLYLATIAAFVLVSVLSKIAPRLVFSNLPLTPYSLAALYPYLYLGLFVPPMWWFVIQPLRLRWQAGAWDRWAWGAGALGLAIALVIAATGFRPWLTAPDIYPALAAAVMAGSAFLALLKARRPEDGKPAYPAWALGPVLAILGAVVLVMGAHAWHEVRAYHYLILGNWHRDQLPLREAEGEDRARRADCGADVQPRAADPGRRDPQPGASSLCRGMVQHPAAPTDRLVLGAQQPRSDAGATGALRGGDCRLQPSDCGPAFLPPLCRPGHVRAWPRNPHPGRHFGRGFGRHYRRHFGREQHRHFGREQHRHFGREQHRHFAGRDSRRWPIAITPSPAIRTTAATTCGAGWSATPWVGCCCPRMTTKPPFAFAAIRPCRPQVAPRRRPDWAGSHMLALCRRPTRPGAANLLNEAVAGFTSALTEDGQSTEALLGLGYAHYTLRQYADAEAAWTKAAELDQNDAVVQLSLGTLYWRLATLGVNVNAPSRNRCTADDLSLDEKRAAGRLYQQAIDWFDRSLKSPGQTREELAFTYRTRAQVQYLLAGCPDQDQTAVLQRAVGSYGEALQLEPANAFYWHMRGRLGYSVWLAADKAAAGSDPAVLAWLADAYQDLAHALDLAPEDRPRDDYLPNQFAGYVVSAAAQAGPAGIQRGLDALAAGDAAKATQWVSNSIEAMNVAARPLTLLVPALAEVDKFIAANQRADAGAIRERLAAAVERARLDDPGTLFGWALVFLKGGLTGDAVDSYRHALTVAVERKDLAAASRAALDLVKLPPTDTAAVRQTFADGYAGLERVTGTAPTLDAAKLGTLAMALGDIPAAARWYNRAIPAQPASGETYAQLLTARDDLRELWAATSVNSDPLLAAMEAELADRLKAEPDLARKDWYWFYRAWFKYHLGRMAYRLGAEAPARSLLDSGQADAARGIACPRRMQTSIPTCRNPPGASTISSAETIS